MRRPVFSVPAAAQLGLGAAWRLGGPVARGRSSPGLAQGSKSRRQLFSQTGPWRGGYPPARPQPPVFLNPHRVGNTPMWSPKNESPATHRAQHQNRNNQKKRPKKELTITVADAYKGEK